MGNDFVLITGDKVLLQCLIQTTAYIESPFYKTVKPVNAAYMFSSKVHSLGLFYRGWGGGGGAGRGLFGYYYVCFVWLFVRFCVFALTRTS